MKKLTITSAIELTETQRKELIAAVEKKHGKVQVNTVIDPKVLGGVKITVDSTQIDATVRNKLSQLQSNLS